MLGACSRVGSLQDLERGCPEAEAGLAYKPPGVPDMERGCPEAEAGLAYKPPGVPDMEEVMVLLVGGLVYTYYDLSLLVRLDLLRQ